MYHFCTYFDRNYLLKGLALYESLAYHSISFTLWVLCFDETTYDLLSRMNLPGVRLIAQTEFEQENADLLRVKEQRRLVEYYWTCTPFLPLYVFDHHPEIELLTYLDADLYFFSDLLPIYQELDGGSILIIEHRFGAELPDAAEKFGKYNVSILVWRRDDEGLASLRRWRGQCLDWCFARVEDGKYGDQKYLDEWPARYPGVVVSQHKGVDLAPWNVDNYRLSQRDGRLWVDEDLLVCYHFHGFHMISRNVFEQGRRHQLTPTHIRVIYPAYIKELQESLTRVRGVAADFNYGLKRYRLHTLFLKLIRRQLIFALGPQVLL